MKLDKADTTFSKYIRLRDDYTCQRCHRKSESVACSHFFGRTGESTRYDPDNCVTLCYGCHQYFDETNREAYRDFKLKQLGEKGFNALKLRANLYKKKDRKMSLLIAKMLLKEEEQKYV